MFYCCKVKQSIMSTTTEGNVRLLSPSMCESCILRRKRKTIRRNIACCIIVAYNVLLLSLILVACWYIFDLQHRLERTEKIVNTQQSHDKGDVVNSPTTVAQESSFSIQIPENSFRQKRSNAKDVTGKVRKGKNKSGRRRRAGKSRRKGESAKSRSERTAATAVPHFYLEGWTMYDELTEATDEIGLFRWKCPDHRSFNRYNDFFHVESVNGYLTKVRIIKPGMYFIFAKVTANGRQTHDSDIRPPVGIQLKKNNEVLEQAWTTQDERGRLYGALDFGHTPERDKYPLDTVTVIGLHYLDTNDEIFIQRPPESIYNIPDRFLSNEINQQFGAFLIEGCLNC